MDDLSKHRDRVFDFFRSCGFCLEDAEDLTQETLFRVARKKDGLRSPDALLDYVLETANNVRINTIRDLHASKRNGKNVSLEELTEQGVDPGELAALQARGDPGPLERVLTKERLDAVQRCLQDLPPGIRQCLQLYAWKEFKYRDIAKILQMPLNTVKSNIHDGRLALKRCVEQMLAEVP